MDKKSLQLVKQLLQKHEDVSVAIVYGSAAEDRQNPKSDFDLAVAGAQPLDSESKMELIEELALITGRPVDLVDLQTTNGTLLKQVLTKGKILYCSNTTLYANIMKRMLFNEADFMPYYFRTLKEQRERWIDG